MPRIVVRAAEPSDSRAIAAVGESAVAVLRKVYRPTPEALANWKKMPALPQLVAVVDGKVVGSVEYSLGEELLHLMALYVAESHRRQGVARALIEELVRIAGGLPVTAHTIRQTGNVAIFQRLGFEVIHEEPARDLISTRGESLVDVYLERR